MGSECCGGSSCDVKTVTREELQAKLKEGKAQVVNVLDPKWYHLGSIKGSVKIPVSEIGKRAGELDKGREVIAYCAGVTCSASKEGAKKLAALGFNVRAYEGGIKEWAQAGLPVEGATQKAGGCCGA